MNSARRVDLRSDTVTVPTGDMRTAMATAEVGDDVYGEDPTITKLEALGAAMVGKECGLFVPSGTMGNQVAVMTHTDRGDEVILDAESHIFYYEVGGLAVLSGVQARTVPSDRGIMDPEQVRAAVRPDNIHFPKTALLCLENTHNRAGGRAIPVDVMDALTAVARDAGVPVHLDGARIFNAATHLGVPASRLTRDVDSVMFCLSKGLAAPVGSVVAGSAGFIERARRSRKILGGGMRQAGILAAAGIVALETMVDGLARDHRLAADLAMRLADVPGICIDPSHVDTNLVMLSVAPSGRSAPEVVDALRERGVLANASGPHAIRLVTHKDVDADDICYAVDMLAGVMTAKGR